MIDSKEKPLSTIGKVRKKKVRRKKMKGGEAVAISERILENQTCVYGCQNHRNEGGIYHHVYIEYKLLNRKNKNKNKN